MSQPETMSAGSLREKLAGAMDLGGAFGRNLHESKGVLLRVGDGFLALDQVSVTSVNGSFVLVLHAGEPIENKFLRVSESL